jgi:hypothetical protein
VLDADDWHTQVSWLLCAYSDDDRSGNLDAARLLRTKCEDAAMNGAGT